MPVTLEEQYPDTRPLEQEVVDVSNCQLDLKMNVMVATQSITKGTDPKAAIDAAYELGKQLPDIINKLGLCTNLRAKGIHHVDYGPARISCAAGFAALCFVNSDPDMDNDGKLCYLEEALGHYSVAHLSFEELAQKHNVRTPFYNSGGNR